MEVWKDIKGYDGIYQISDLGRVKSLSRPKLIRGLHPCITKEKFLKISYMGIKKYPSVNLFKDSKKSSFGIHQLLAITFLNHKICGHRTVVDHKDNNNKNNSLDNLQLITNRINCSKDKKNKASKYTGLYFDKHNNKWRARIIVNGKNKCLGRFVNEYDAHLAYQQALNEINTK